MRIILKITRVGALDGEMLDIEMSNGSVILLDTGAVIHRPEFAALREEDRFRHPKTDSRSVYWENGPRLSIGEIMALLKKAPQEKK